MLLVVRITALRWVEPFLHKKRLKCILNKYGLADKFEEFKKTPYGK